MTPYFDHHRIAGDLFNSTLAVFAISEFRQTIRWRTGAQKADRYSVVVVRVCVYGALATTVAASSALPAFAIRGGAVAFAVGLAMTWAGVALRWWAIRSLGKFFTVTVMTSRDQPVITTGPYRVLRHPSYSGAELAFLGFAVMFGNWIGVAAVALLPMVGFVYRIRVEERALTATLGETYASFAAGRKRMIPFVW